MGKDIEYVDKIPLKNVRVLTLFVSSTFKDMHAERDCISNFIAPEINNRLRYYGISLRFIDLRWGIVTKKYACEEERESTILKVCFNEIQRSRPLFIGLLGQRYGWVPDSEHRNKLDYNVRRFLPNEDISVTEMEMRFGALGQSEVNKHAIFCLRKPSYDTGSENVCEIDEKTNNHLKRLRNTIRQKIDADRCIDYDVKWKDGDIVDLGSFQTQLTKVIWREACEMLGIDTNKMQPIIENSVFDDVGMRHQQLIEVFVGRNQELKHLQTLLNSGKQVAVIGKRGCGKSALLAKLYSHVKILPSCIPVYYDVMTCADTLSPLTMLNFLCSNFAQALGVGFYGQEDQTGVTRLMGDYTIVEASLAKLENKLNDLCQKLEAHGKTPIIIIDGLDMLRTNRYRNNWLFVPHGVSAVVALNNNESIVSENVQSFRIDDLKEDDACSMIQEIFAFYDKQITDVVEQALLQKAVHNEHYNPMWISILSHYFIHFDVDDFKAMLNINVDDEELRIEKYCLQLIEEVPADIVGLMHFVVNKAAKVFGRDTVERGMSLLCLGRQGFRDIDFEIINNHQWDALRFAEFCRWMHPFISESFKHHQWMMLHRWLAEEWIASQPPNNLLLEHDRIAKMLMDYDILDPVRNQEAFYHAYHGGNWNLCAQLVANAGHYTSIPIMLLMNELSNVEKVLMVKQMISSIGSEIKAETLCKTFQLILGTWATKNPEESGKLVLDCLSYFHIDEITDDYQFTCLSEVLKNRMQDANRSGAVHVAVSLAQRLHQLSKKWNKLKPGKGDTGLTTAGMTIFDYYSKLGDMEKAMKYYSF